MAGAKADEVDKASKWLMYTVVIDESNGNFKLNKADLPDQAAFGEEQIRGATKGFDSPFYYTSARTGENVEALFRSLADGIARSSSGK